MTPVITLTTDFGDAGPFVAVMKAVIRRHAPEARIADLNHRVAPCQPAEAGFWLARCYRYFPAGSVHVAVVDPGVGTARAIVSGETDGHVFLAPDNGILPMIGDMQLRTLSSAWLAQQNWPVPSFTFHGRDIFAPLAAALLTGRIVPADIGPQTATPVSAAAPPPTKSNGRITGQVVAIDTWGNLISNIDVAMIEGLHVPRVRIGPVELPIRQTYGTATAGALLALVNSFGVIEIARREGSAAATLGLAHGAAVVVTAS